MFNNKIRKVTGICSLAILGFSAGVSAAEESFWKNRPELMRQIQVDRRIIVSVTNDDQRTFLKGVGLIRKPLKKVWSLANDPDFIAKKAFELEDFKWSLSTFEWQARVVIVSFGYTLKGNAKPIEAQNRIEFSLTEGVNFKAQGSIYFEENEQGTLVTILAQSDEGVTLSWPLRVAGEIVMQKIASSLRTAAEAAE